MNIQLILDVCVGKYKTITVNIYNFTVDTLFATYFITVHSPKSYRINISGEFLQIVTKNKLNRNKSSFEFLQIVCYANLEVLIS